MVLLWPLAGEELKRIQREALDPVVVTQLRKVQHLKPLGRGRWRRPPRSQQAVEEAEARDAVLRRVEPLRWSVKRGEALRMVMEAKVSRKKVALEVDCGSDTTLNFGDAVRVVLPGLGEDTISTCLSACVRPGATSQVGFREAQAADASFEERRLAKDLASWGRRAYDFVALSCAPMEDAILRRSAWTVYRANVMDAFQGPKVHYGQHLMLGQPEATKVPTKELLLSCEPPSRCGGVGAAYQLMGRFYGFGHASTGRRSWNTVFTLVPVDDDLHLGDEVDVMRGGRIVPLAPFSYLHGTRLVQAMYFGLPNRVGRQCISRAVKLADGREELLVHAPREPKDEEGCWDAEWMLQPLILPQEPCMVEPRLTDFARWDRLRTAILERLLHRREVFAFSTLRKILSKDQILPTKDIPLLAPSPNALLSLSDQILVGQSFVASTFQNSYGLIVGKKDMQLIAQCFGPESLDGISCDEAVVNVDLFLDALRGETSVGRSRTLDQLYSQLQKQAGKPQESLTTSWIQFHIETTAAERIRPGVKEPDQRFRGDELMAALPLLRSHAGVTRQIFLRWQMDVLALVPSHEAMLQSLHQIWGDVVLSLLTREEKLNWKLPMPCS